MELIYTIFSFLGISNLVFTHRSKISEFLGKSKIGIWIMAPIMVPYATYVLIKLVRNEDFIMRMAEAEKQKKINDYF